MAKRSIKTSNIFDAISADDALAIPRLLAKEEPKIANRIEQIATEYLKGVDIKDKQKPFKVRQRYGFLSTPWRKRVCKDT